ncbi:DUF4157 domain-containing protein [Nocardioides sp. LMS-CY]|uniref:eCIS core domain-containing protein n=1 Tax=Nocardioides sp. (strain LMS-CY) TaxID=2840457 RepID=UPI001C0009A3|nr:DUF4157 domain-containing protein [Nocardioides sp. LMS-CY]QWF21397.1 DUF4157 domain-containing protein [Nocardioides sp. LMS-CY]
MRESDRAAREERESAVPVREQPEAAEPEREEANPLLSLQQGIGNRGLGHLLARAQPKLTVGHSADPAELEADRVAARVVSALGGGHSSACGSACAHDSGSDGPDAVRRKVGAEGGALDEADERDLTAATRSGGSALPERTRTEMEGAFGADFGGVKVHTDGTAAALASSMSARAFTVGSHIFLGKGQSTDDRSLMAHELTHTIQQS